MRRKLLTGVAALVLAHVPHAQARTDSHASRGMGAGWGPCANGATAAEKALMRHESMGWPTASNPTSSARGCSQALRSTRLRFAKVCHVSPDTLDVAGQMCILRSYVKVRYGTAERALQYRRKHGYY